MSRAPTPEELGTAGCDGVLPLDPGDLIYLPENDEPTPYFPRLKEGDRLKWVAGDGRTIATAICGKPIPVHEDEPFSVRHEITDYSPITEEAMSETSPTTPLLATRDTLREVLAEHFIMWRELGEGPRGEWFCACGLKFGFSDSAIDHQADALSGVVRDPATIADDEALVDNLNSRPAWRGQGDYGTSDALEALAAALTEDPS